MGASNYHIFGLFLLHSLFHFYDLSPLTFEPQLFIN
jgi:hypothetical protein